MHRCVTIIPDGVTTASGLLPADYCQRELPFDVQRRRTELVWKSAIWFGYKALGPKARAADVNHYCQLGKMAVVTRDLRFTEIKVTEASSDSEGVEATPFTRLAGVADTGERIGKVAGRNSCGLRSAAVNTRRANAKRRGNVFICLRYFFSLRCHPI